MRVQLFELVVALIALFTAIHLSLPAAAVSGTVAGYLLILVLSTAGPFGIARRFSVHVNLVLLGVAAVVAAVAPVLLGIVGLHRVTMPCELAAVVLAGLLIGLWRRPSLPVAAPMPTADTSSSMSLGQQHARMAGRHAARGVAGASVAWPIVARRLGAVVGRTVRGRRP